jgi:hypothetical protein
METEITISTKNLEKLIESALLNYRNQFIPHINEKRSLCPNRNGKGGVCYTTFYWPSVRYAIESPKITIDLINNKCLVSIPEFDTPKDEQREVFKMLELVRDTEPTP